MTFSNPDVALGVVIGEVAVNSQAAPGTGQEHELLFVVEFDALCGGRTDIGETRELDRRALIETRIYGGGKRRRRGDDVVAE